MSNKVEEIIPNNKIESDKNSSITLPFEEVEWIKEGKNSSYGLDCEKYLEENKFNHSMLGFIGMSSDMLRQIAGLVERRYEDTIQHIMDDWDELRKLDEEGFESALMINRDCDSMYEELRISQADNVKFIERTGIMDDICMV